MTTNPQKRESNFELLRIFAAMAVVTLHFNYIYPSGGALANARGSTYNVLLFFETLSICAVNLFILLSGYFGCNSRSIKVGKLLKLLLQTICISCITKIISSMIHHQWDLKEILASFIPANYYVVLYISLMLIAPFINKLIDSLSQRSFRNLIILVFLLFSVYSIAVDILKEITDKSWSGLSSIGIDGSMNGYSIINFILVYLIGVWLRKKEFTSKASVTVLISVLIGCIVALIGWRRFLPKTAWAYNNPLVILEACLIFLLFGKIRLTSKLVNALAPASFTCYLIHGSIIVALDKRISISHSLPEALALLFVIAIGIFLISFMIMKIWEIIIVLTQKKIVKRIPNIQVD